MIKNEVTWSDVDREAKRISYEIQDSQSHFEFPICLYGIPRGGIYAAQNVQLHLCLEGFQTIQVDDPAKATYLIDDIVDCGKTRDIYVKKFNKPFFALFDKIRDPQISKSWISFPWERMQVEEDGPQYNIFRMQQFIGDNEENRIKVIGWLKEYGVLK
jgi:hypoxanthine phosphoribosyltransferase